MIRDKYKRPAFVNQPVGGGARLTTSAMIASIAGPDQPTRAAPFGHALVELAKTRPDIVGTHRRPRPSTPTCTSSRKPIPIASTRWAWRNNC